MPIKSVLLFFVAVFIGLATSPAYAGDIISCDSFESCPALPTDEILALEARIEALETLLAGTTRGIDPSTSQDTLTFGNSISGEAVLSRELSITDKKGSFPVCFNGSGELLPCATNDPPPASDPYVGQWSGRMIFDRNSTGTCHDADVSISISSYNAPLDQIDYLIVIRDSGGLDNVGGIGFIQIETGSADSSFNMFYSEIGTQTNYTLQFNTQGSAQGYWNYYNGDCYGRWSFTKD